jgi:hypothetical protein
MVSRSGCCEKIMKQTSLNGVSDPLWAHVMLRGDRAQSFVSLGSGEIFADDVRHFPAVTQYTYMHACQLYIPACKACT